MALRADLVFPNLGRGNVFMRTAVCFVFEQEAKGADVTDANDDIPNSESANSQAGGEKQQLTPAEVD